MRTTDRLVAAVVAAMVLASLTWLELTTDRGFLLLAVPVVVLLGLISAVARRFGITSWLIHLWQLLVLVGIGVGLGLGANPEGGTWLSQLWQLYLEGLLHIQTSSAPMPPSPGVRWLVLLVIGLVFIIADVLVVSLATPAWGLAPLLTLYLIPALALPRPVHWPSFLVLGVAYLVILATDQLNQLASWTRNLAADNAARTHARQGVWQMALVVGAPVLALSLAVGSLLPTLGSLDIESRRPRGSGPIQLLDPTVELNRNLAQQSDRVVITYTSSSPTGEYLRMTSLPVMDRSGWKLTAMDLRQGTDLGPPPGLTNPGQTFTTDIQVGELGSQYLPVPYPATAVEIEGAWGYDPRTLTVVATGQDNTDATRNTSYRVTSLGADPDPQAFSLAEAGTPADAAITTVVPDDVPAEITELTAEVTRNAPTDVLKAAAIQDYLRDPRNFQYSTQAPPGDGYEVLTNFLFRDKEGYCIHFAAAMAVMSRISGIPSRVAVGFLPGSQQGETWQVQARNMHAWPELYFEGYGWVRFEPTSAVADAPDWTVASDPTQPSTTPTPTPTPSVSTSSTTSSSPTAGPSLPDDEDPTSSADAAGIPWRQLVWGLLGTAGVALVAALPWLVRTLVRRRRLAGAATDPHEQVAGLWAEVRDTLVDAGERWPSGTPRERAAMVGAPLSWDAKEGLARLAGAVERSRYARSLDQAPATLVDDVRQLVREVTLRQTRGRRWLMTLLPASLWTNLGAKFHGR